MNSILSQMFTNLPSSKSSKDNSKKEKTKNMGLVGGILESCRTLLCREIDRRVGEYIICNRIFSYGF